jgi:vacuolar-type H+-ATPase subunit I/STV1
MISSVDNFSNVASYTTGLTQPHGLNTPAYNEEAEYSIQKNKQTEESKDSSSSKYSANTFSSNKEELTEEELKKIEELKKRDAEVRAHEQAHQSAAGSLSNGSTSFDYEEGPDGKRYAVGGEVSIDISKVAGDPQATIEKARQVRRAALAPADPSGHRSKQGVISQTTRTVIYRL